MKMLTTQLATLTATLFIAALTAAPALASDEILIAFQSINDPDVTPDPTVCPRSGFPADGDFVISEFGASLFAQRTHPQTGLIRTEARRQIGTATACVSLDLQNLDFVPGDQIPIFGEFTLYGIPFELDGTCTVASNDIPVAGLFLTACAMATTTPPAGIAGASAASNSVFNVNQIPGFDTGSFWTLRIFLDD